MQRNEIDELFMKQQELEKKEEQQKLLLHSNAMNIKRGRHELSNDGKGSPANSQRGHARKRTASKLNIQSEDKEKKNHHNHHTKKTKRSHSSNQHLLGIANESSDAKTERSSVELFQGTNQSE
jgi:hypothetical protein